MHRTLGVRVRGAVGAETDDAGEEQRHAVVSARRNGSVVAQLVCHRDRQHRVQKSAKKCFFLIKFAILFVFIYLKKKIKTKLFDKII